MPYVPSVKTDGSSQDRIILDAAVEGLASTLAGRITNNFSLITVYKSTFKQLVIELQTLFAGKDVVSDPTSDLAMAIYDLGESYNYEGAFLGELNYSITRLLERVPQVKVEKGEWTDEFRYWSYAAAVSALIWTSIETAGLDIGVSGVFEDIKDEFKRRVNTSYEAAQIIKSGDCYSGPYYTRLVEVVDEDGKHVGHQEIMLKRSDETLGVDILPAKIVLKK